jgi:hypothetical protein
VVQAHIQSRVLFLLALNAFLLVVGCLMDIFSAIVVVVPLILPISQAFSIHPLHADCFWTSSPSNEPGPLDHPPLGRPEALPAPQAVGRGGEEGRALLLQHAPATGGTDRIDSICFAAPVFFHLTRSLFATTP